jgi:phosphoenolpyruvate carboxylase
MLPAWCGSGSAVGTWLAGQPETGMATLQAMYREWPFFQMLLSNRDRVSAKERHCDRLAPAALPLDPQPLSLSRPA